MRTIRTIIITLCFVLLSATGLTAQSARIEGRVLDDSGQPMEMVSVRLSRQAIGTVTNFKGEYSLQVPMSDTLRVIFTSVGYRRVEHTVNTTASDRIRLDVQMRVNEAYIHDVEVTSQHQQVGTTERLEADDILSP